MSMARLIDADALIQRIDKGVGVTGIGLEPVMAIRDIKELISTMPTVNAEPVVRCRSCRHYNTWCCGEGFGWCERRDFGTNEEWYCHDGEAGTYEND